jgi:hypothetical protein
MCVEYCNNGSKLKSSILSAQWLLDGVVNTVRGFMHLLCILISLVLVSISATFHNRDHSPSQSYRA